MNYTEINHAEPIQNGREEKLGYYERRKLKEYCGSCGCYLGENPIRSVCDDCDKRIRTWGNVNRDKVNAKRREKSSRNKVGVLRKLKRYKKIEDIAYKAALYDLVTELGTKGVAKIFGVKPRSVETWTFDKDKNPNEVNARAIEEYFKIKGYDFDIRELK